MSWHGVYNEAAYNFFSDDPRERSITLNNMSYVRMMQGAYADSIRLAQQARKDAALAEDNGMLYGAIANEGYAEFLQGNNTRAEELYEEALAMDPAYVSPISRAYGLNNLGEILRALGDADRRGSFLKKPMPYLSPIRIGRGMAFTMNNRGGILFVLSNYVDARKLYQDAYRLHREIGDISRTAHSLSALGNVERLEGEFDQANMCYEESLRLRQNIGDRRVLLTHCLTSLKMPLILDKWTKHRISTKRGCKSAVKLVTSPGVGFGLNGMGMVLLKLGELSKAKEHFDEAMQIGRETGHAYINAQALAGTGRGGDEAIQLASRRKHSPSGA